MSPITNKNVLIVDDSPAVLMVLSNAMKARGFEVETAKSGEAALEILEQRSFGLILVDLLMPGIDGLEVCRRLSTRPDRANFKVVVCSGCDELEIVQSIMAAGADAFFVKEGAQEQFSDRLATLFASIQKTDETKTE
jgi:CheY-like chemotaxis protein